MARLVRSWHGGLGLSVSLLGAFALSGWACSDALHIEPPAPGPGGTTDVGGAGGEGATGGSGPTGGSGGTAPVLCESNTDCPSPTPVCDTVKGQCFECLVLSDCAYKPNTVCSLGACSCPVEGESWCAPSTCVDLETSPTNCGSCGHLCFGACSGGECVDAWEPTGTTGAPEARAQHVAVWTGSQMIVWGGANGDCDTCTTNTGAMYDPETYEWVPTSLVDVPTPRRLARAVWTGTQMVVWGGYNGGAVGTGGVFDPATNSWTPISMTTAPSARYGHAAVWTGTEMIVWGGTDGTTRLLDGARYNPQTNQWVAIASTSPGRDFHSAVYVDDEMWIYGGQGNDGTDPNAYLPPVSGAVVGGWKYSRTGNTWDVLSPTTNQPTGRTLHTAVAIGSQMIVWGGFNGTDFLSTGARYDATGWIATLPQNEPVGRRNHTAVAMGTPEVMVVWGGEGAAGALDSGGTYNPGNNGWTALPTGLSARYNHTAVSTGSTMIVWGGQNGSTRLATGGVYTP
jgi:N-acetylneuraminic acid mutarotase